MSRIGAIVRRLYGEDVNPSANVNKAGASMNKRPNKKKTKLAALKKALGSRRTVIWIIRIVVNSVSKGMVRAKIDESLQKFLGSMFSILLKVLLLISVASTVGIEVTSFIAVLGAAGLAVGLALQGSLSNFAGGVLLLLFKPFGVGDVIDTQGYAGKVESIQI